MDRRRLLQSVPPFLLASSVPFSWSSASAARKSSLTALLVPKTGNLASLGRSMERAALLVQGVNEAKQLLVLDTGGSPGGAAAAAAEARKRGAEVILGPVLSSSVAAVVAAAGPAIPVVAFSNDAALHESGAFTMGITAQQTVAAVLRFAANRGIRRIAVAEEAGAWAQQAASAAADEGLALGLELTKFSDGAELGRAFATSPDGYPDAVLMSDPAALARLMPQLRQIGIQPLAAFGELDLAAGELAALGGTWLAAPDPERFSQFAAAYEERVGTRPGLITALAYDAANAVRRMRLGGAVDRSAVLSDGGFEGVCGRVRFREDGSASRELAVLELTASGVRKIHAAA